MRHVKVEEHRSGCEGVEKWNKIQERKRNGEEMEFWEEFPEHCVHNHTDFLFYLNGIYILYTFPSCWERYGHLELKEDLIRRIANVNKIEAYEIHKSREIGREFQNLRKNRITLKDTFEQVHFYYFDAAGKEYGITSYLTYEEAVKREMFTGEKEYDDAVKYIKNLYDTRKQEILLEELRNLRIYNKIYNIDDIEICRTIKSMVTNINKQIKTKTNEQKRQERQSSDCSEVGAHAS